MMRFKTLSVVALAAGALGLCSAAYASQGFYIGGQAGYGQADYDVSNPNIPGVSLSKDEDGIAGRAYVGYQFNQYFGVETGYTKFSDSTYKYKAFGQTIAEVKAKTQQWDVLAKAGMPFGCSGFRGDIKAGAAYVMSDFDASAVGFGKNSDSENNWDPAAGASLTYNFNKNFAVDVSYLHTFGSGSSNHGNGNTNPDTNLATVGVSYLFA